MAVEKDNVVAVVMASILVELAKAEKLVQTSAAVVVVRELVKVLEADLTLVDVVEVVVAVIQVASVGEVEVASVVIVVIIPLSM